ncbi:hypothetical protein [Nitrospirillum pindoramense]|uniref:hypothetical protein n=1 Tax=Nitrospirillum amazonense TaxID=28077 RepID=UPI0011A1A913|nr:hypothetical protein [Nitrospirillum amazonense]
MLEDEALEDGLDRGEFLGRELVERLQDQPDALVLGSAFVLIEDERIRRDVEGDGQVETAIR